MYHLCYLFFAVNMHTANYNYCKWILQNRGLISDFAMLNRHNFICEYTKPNCFLRYLHIVKYNDRKVEVVDIHA